MSEKTTTNQPEASTTQLITVSKDRKAITSSITVAEYFGKQHFNVLEDIKTLEKKCPLNFQGANYKDKQGKSRPMYEMDRTGFTLLAMGFTGEKALDFKIRYIQAFDAMEEELTKQKDGGPRRIDDGPTRVCGACGSEKPLGEFFKNRSTRDGYAWECKPCSKLLRRRHIDGNAARNLAVIPAYDVKFCPVCRKEKPVTEFYIDQDRADGRSSQCKTCTHEKRSKGAPPIDAVNDQSGAVFEEFKKNAMFLIDHYKSMLAEYRTEISGYRNELSFYRRRNPGLDSEDYARLTDKARKCLSSLAPAHANMTRESLVEMAVCMAVGSGKGRRMDS